MGYSIIQDFKTGSFIKIGKHEKCNDDEYVLSIVEPDNKNAVVWLNHSELVKLRGHIDELIELKLSQTKD